MVTQKVNIFGTMWKSTYAKAYSKYMYTFLGDDGSLAEYEAIETGPR